MRPFGRDGFDADQCALDVGPLHRVEELRILGRLHRDLSEEHGVGGQLLEAGHQLEAFGACGLELFEMTWIVPARRHPKILERDWIEIVVSERDEAESATPEIDDLFEHTADVPLSWFLTIRAPDGAERAVLRASANRLHRGPHVAPLRQEFPASGKERLTAHTSAVVATFRPAG